MYHISKEEDRDFSWVVFRFSYRKLERREPGFVLTGIEIWNERFAFNGVWWKIIALTAFSYGDGTARERRMRSAFAFNGSFANK